MNRYNLYMEASLAQHVLKRLKPEFPSLIPSIVKELEPDHARLLVGHWVLTFAADGIHLESDFPGDEVNEIVPIPPEHRWEGTLVVYDLLEHLLFERIGKVIEGAF